MGVIRSGQRRQTMEALAEQAGPAVVIQSDLLPGVRKVLLPGLPVLVVPRPREIAEASGLSPETCQAQPGLPERGYGEAVHAIVQPQLSHLLTSAAVQAYLRGRIARYKAPRQVEFAVELPGEYYDKTCKYKLREPFWTQTGRSL